jgi:F-type H+-transporting ATPase subunit b
MQELFTTLGIDWKLLLAQGFNFAVVLMVLTRFVYRPLVAMMDERRNKIEKGLQDAAAAEVRLAEIAHERKTVLRNAEKEGEHLIDVLEARGKESAALLVQRATEDAEQLLKDASEEAKKEKAREIEKVKGSIGEIIVAAISQAVAADPKRVDKALVTEASDILKKQLHSL